MKKILSILILAAIIFGSIAYYFYQKSPTSTNALKADYQLTANDLFTEFERDETAANTKYLDKIIEVTGIVKESSSGASNILKVTLDGGGIAFGVICQMENASKITKDFKEGDLVTFKGICTGMLMDVVLVRCVENK